MFARINDIDVYYEIHGTEGPWLTFSHSLAAHSGMWAPQVEAFSHRFRVLNYDTRGHGKTTATDSAYSLDQLADDLKGLLDHLDIRQTHYCGLSMGGMIGQTFALEYPGRLQSLVLADTTSRYEPETKALWDARVAAARSGGMAALVAPTLGRWFTEPFHKDPAAASTLERVGTMIRDTPLAGYAGCCAALPTINVTHRLQEITVPILVLCGAHDHASPVAMASQIVAHARDGELEVIEEAAHISNLEQPQIFNRALTRFFDRVS